MSITHATTWYYQTKYEIQYLWGRSVSFLEMDALEGREAVGTNCNPTATIVPYQYIYSLEISKLTQTLLGRLVQIILDQYVPVNHTGAGSEFEPNSHAEVRQQALA